MGLKLTLFKAWFLFKAWLALIIRNHGLQTSVVRFGVSCWHYSIFVACRGVACSYYTQSWLADFSGAVYLAGIILSLWLAEAWLALIIHNHGLQTSMVRFGETCWHYSTYVACRGVACSYYTQLWFADFNGAVWCIVLALFYICGSQTCQR